MENNTPESEISLDPQDWEAMRQLGHRMVDDMVDYLATIGERPGWQPYPAEVGSAIKQPLPHHGQDAARVYEEFKRNILPYPMGNIHPRFWSWYMGNGTLLGALADFLASGMNPNLGGANQAPVLVEHQVIDWCKEMIGYPVEASGLLVSGGSKANFAARALGSNAKCGFGVRV